METGEDDEVRFRFLSFVDKDKAEDELTCRTTLAAEIASSSLVLLIFS